MGSSGLPKLTVFRPTATTIGIKIQYIPVFTHLKDVVPAFSMSLLVFCMLVLIIIYQDEELLKSYTVYKSEVNKNRSK